MRPLPLTPPGMPARHQGGFLWFALQILPSLGQAYQSKFSQPLQIHGLVRLRYDTSSPGAFAAQGACPRLILIDSITHIKLRHRIASLELFEFHHTQLSAYLVSVAERLSPPRRRGSIGSKGAFCPLLWIRSLRGNDKKRFPQQ